MTKIAISIINRNVYGNRFLISLRLAFYIYWSLCQWKIGKRPGGSASGRQRFKRIGRKPLFAAEMKSA